MASELFFLIDFQVHIFSYICKCFLYLFCLYVYSGAGGGGGDGKEKVETRVWNSPLSHS